MNLQQAFILLTNKHSAPVMELFQHIHSSSQTLGDAYLAYHQTTEDIPNAIKQVRHFAFTDDVLTRLDYDAIDDEVYTNTHFGLMDFYLKNPSYDYYWYIEDDVKFNGDWNCLFNFFTEYYIQPDFISSHLSTFQESPKWYWWASLYHPYNNIPLYLRVRSFNPIIRISNAALRCIHNVLKDKWQGHHEVLLSTFLLLEGFHIADFGGRGPFVMPGQEDQFYVPDDTPDGINTGTMRFRPAIKPSEIKIENKLYHPVKPWLKEGELPTVTQKPLHRIIN